MEINQIYYGFRLESITPTVSPSATVYKFLHTSSSAPLYFISRDDDNKTFAIGFNTPAFDDTGVFHILEHSTLCGSDKYPVKEPFVELLKGSLYTFLNAMTYSDRTVYPVSSVNDRDFLNLISVYMDAVLHPVALSDGRIFRQEGWHVEPVTDEGGNLVGVEYNGVVYNEMKGAYSDPDTVNYMAICRALFPDTAYSKDSGGTPEGIPTLTFEGFKEAHKKYYHPSNSCMVLDGNVDLSAVLPLLDSFLAEYGTTAPVPHTDFQKNIGEVRDTVYVEATSVQDVTDKAKLLVAFRSPDGKSKEATLALTLISEVLTDTNQSPLKKPLIESGLCGDVFFFSESSGLVDFIVIELQDVKDGVEDKLLELLYSTLSGIIRKGISKAKLKSAHSYAEFKYKESDVGYSPKGIVYASVIFGSYFHGNDPVSALDLTDVFATLREKIGTDYYTDLLERYTLKNPERAIIRSLPSLTVKDEIKAREDSALAELFEKIRSEGREAETVAEYEDFAHWQGRENTPEALATVPKLSLSDLTPPTETPTVIRRVDGVKVISHPIETDGIIYADLIFNVDDLTDGELSRLSFFSSVITELTTEKYTPQEAADRIRAYLGGFYSTVSHVRSATPTPYIKITVSSLQRCRGMMARIISEVLTSKRCGDLSEYQALLQQTVSQQRETICAEGMASAVLTASAPFNPGAVIANATVGIGYYKTIKSILDSFDTEGASLIRDLDCLAKKVFTKERLTLSLTGKYYPDLAKRIINCLPSTEKPKKREIEKPKLLNRGIALPSRVSYAVTAGHLALGDPTSSDPTKVRMNGSLAVARSILRLVYLWDEVRVKGGAYGSGITMDRFGDFQFTSYRDPNPARSLEVYRRAPDFLRRFVGDGSDLTEHVIGTAGKMSLPSSPRQTGEAATMDHLGGITAEYKMKLYEGILCADSDGILKAADLIEASLCHTATAVAGKREDLEALGDRLDEIIDV